MFKRLTYLFIYLFIYLAGKSQVNLVPNPSFEDTISALASCSNQMPISSIKDWYKPCLCSPDYYNICANPNGYPNYGTVPLNCFGYQNPKSGNAYVGSILYGISFPFIDSTQIGTEYISVKLKQPLIANQCYYGELYISLSEAFHISVNQIGMYLTSNSFTTSIGSFTNTIQPQIQWDTTQYFTDTLNWIKIEGLFLAQGGEQYLTIGNFKDGARIKKKSVNSNFSSGCSGTNLFISYIYIDDVALYELPTPQLQSNAITICPNADTLVLGDTSRIQTHYQWFANGNAIDTTSYIKVKPTQTTTYVLQTTQCSINTQSIVVTYSNNCEPIVVVEPIIPNVFTPNNDSINDVWRFTLGKGNNLKSLNIYNRWGNEIAVNSRTSVTQINWDGRTTSGEETPNGVYFYVLQYTDANGDEHKKNGYITLIR